MFMWYLRWWRYALEHRINPFLTDLLWAPLGFNLAWTTFIPIPAWIVMPIGPALGEAAAYNISMRHRASTSRGFYVRACRRVGRGAFWPSVTRRLYCRFFAVHAGVSCSEGICTWCLPFRFRWRF